MSTQFAFSDGKPIDAVGPDKDEPTEDVTESVDD
jgi:hypothetical protein